MNWSSIKSDVLQQMKQNSQFLLMCSKARYFFYFLWPGLHCANTYDVSIENSRTIRLENHVLIYLYIACIS